ncbi:hypothetical protein Pmani_030419 [Petrolisthes manimaculis]|uniref:Uncharacterized protein n=1 Tax=Petrolisthes manimaculis TaxID=1843537 RepID=A0AAE1NXB6_9EUCA|nr:hypothetical protein Pmani_030419 [Petrolisthes manimaculis]
MTGGVCPSPPPPSITHSLLPKHLPHHALKLSNFIPPFPSPILPSIPTNTSITGSLPEFVRFSLILSGNTGESQNIIKLTRQVCSLVVWYYEGLTDDAAINSTYV